MNQDVKSIPAASLRAFCERHAIRRLGFFGSVVRDEATPESDLDVLVEFEPGKTPGFFGFAAIQLELGGLLGRSIDLRTAHDLSPHFREEVLRSAVWNYAA
jgi:uncharacterized protein